MNDQDRLIKEQQKLIDAQQKIIDALAKQLLLGNRPATYPVPYPVYPTPTPWIYEIWDSGTAEEPHGITRKRWEVTSGFAIYDNKNHKLYDGHARSAVVLPEVKDEPS